MSATVTVIRAAVPSSVDEVRTLLRELAQAGATARAEATAARAEATDRTIRTWAFIGDLTVEDGLSENERVVEHDRIGRQAVRLAVDKTLCIGDSRAVHALHQGAVMEGSWGEEAAIVASAEAAGRLLCDDASWRPGDGDVVLVAANSASVAGLLDTVAGDLAYTLNDHRGNAAR
ncbi:UDP-N-acetylmuramoyl-tripeptide--D-alanyl-D-alanine ligase [Gordonia sp. ABSL1-1]|uniref:UDP-N-acetylmuramoyl-tripeptide--D-alanyl-D- alanine ligase n=1 Tax=Gordonia sp. ABSL1-1 TaxID=3053923 RepID=UPI0025736BEB|nr:UDP-N-acetylmuramoyl-tripeptide--D-alanyl-D-alanine ligase [Gordonia sp. ABSL1-1]MDL9937402.1 UDP-N-acetylmuramoyl-tripeptide--D-alanyl-D-alanine ligase [Gordonia sp. ABSL1-1]